MLMRREWAVDLTLGEGDDRLVLTLAGVLASPLSLLVGSFFLVYTPIWWFWDLFLTGFSFFSFVWEGRAEAGYHDPLLVVVGKFYSGIVQSKE
jgi:hypothetical protein